MKTVVMIYMLVVIGAITACTYGIITAKSKFDTGFSVFLLCLNIFFLLLNIYRQLKD